MSDARGIGIVLLSELRGERRGGRGDGAWARPPRGHRVNVLASAAAEPKLTESDRLRIHTVQVPDYPVFEHRPYELAMAAAIVDVVTAERLDLLHVHYAIPHAASAYTARQILGSAAPRCVITLHGTDVTRANTPGHRAVTRFTVAAADQVTVPSVFLRDAAQGQLGPTRRHRSGDPQLRRHGHFLPPASPRPRALRHCSWTTVRCSSMSRNFRSVKRTTDLIDVMVAVRGHAPAHLVLVGEGT